MPFKGEQKKNVNAVTISGTANHQQHIEPSSSQSNTAQLITVPVRSSQYSYNFTDVGTNFDSNHLSRPFYGASSSYIVSNTNYFPKN